MFLNSVISSRSFFDRFLTVFCVDRHTFSKKTILFLSSVCLQPLFSYLILVARMFNTTSNKIAASRLTCLVFHLREKAFHLPPLSTMWSPQRRGFRGWWSSSLVEVYSTRIQFSPWMCVESCWVIFVHQLMWSCSFLLCAVDMYYFDWLFKSICIFIRHHGALAGALGSSWPCVGPSW